MSRTYEHKTCENCDDANRIYHAPKMGARWQDAWVACDECETCHHCGEMLADIWEEDVCWDAAEEMWTCSEKCLKSALVDREKFFALRRAAELTRKINQTLLSSDNV